jgi:hypothetical protein
MESFLVSFCLLSFLVFLAEATSTVGRRKWAYIEFLLKVWSGCVVFAIFFRARSEAFG